MSDLKLVTAEDDKFSSVLQHNWDGIAVSVKSDLFCLAIALKPTVALFQLV